VVTLRNTAFNLLNHNRPATGTPPCGTRALVPTTGLHATPYYTITFIGTLSRSLLQTRGRLELFARPQHWRFATEPPRHSFDNALCCTSIAIGVVAF